LTRTLAALAVLATAGLGLALPQTAAAQSRPNDRQYCDALVELYRAYVNEPMQGRQQRPPNVEPEVGISKCQTGDTATGIPILEKALRDSRITLPARG
jgi:hypothetical protein